MDLPLKAQRWRMFKTHVFEIQNMVLEKKPKHFNVDCMTAILRLRSPIRPFVTSICISNPEFRIGIAINSGRFIDVYPKLQVCIRRKQTGIRYCVNLSGCQIQEKYLNVRATKTYLDCLLGAVFSLVRGHADSILETTLQKRK
ncbi:hypothetical protein TcasGA2_TC016091 [Tribolium castaneum]|uniref:Uncharacterized protein n=1 Tax=Tribolium castaneum TaxID=7070 RepID=D6X3L1_TRICA|nr:hypothetical protein TcasGA2_TC016091 [Tribolium castaneum]